MNRFNPIRYICVAIVLLTTISGCQPKPDFHTAEHGPASWQDYEGQYVVVNYFAEWCAPCLRELPELNEFHRLYGDQVALLGVSFDQLDNTALANLRAKYQIEFPLIQSTPAPRLPFPRPAALPATYVVTPSGEVKGPLLGEQTIASLKSATAITP